MKMPATNQTWLTDVQDAYDLACLIFEKDRSCLSSISDLFKLSARIAGERRGIVDPELIQQMSVYTTRQIETDLENGGDPTVYKFYFVISYIHCHVCADLIEEMQADKIMKYVNENWDLFDAHA